MGFSDAWRPQEEYVFAVGDEAQCGQFADLTLTDSGLESEVELVQGLDEREMGQFCLHRHIPFVAS